MENPIDIKKLAELLNPKQFDQSDSEDEIDGIQNNITAHCSPGDVAKKPVEKERKPSVYTKIEEEKKEVDIRELNNDDEHKLFYEDGNAGQADWKTTPQWDISYKQQVSATDVFFQMSGKTLSTASCEDMLVKIHLPEEDHHNIDFKVTKNNITLVSSKYKLDVPLPQPVNPKLGNAQWDKDTEKLIVTLRMDREFDYVNF